MKKDHAKLTRASIDIELFECNDEGKVVKPERLLTYSLKPLRDKHIAELDKWVQSRYIKLAMKAAAELDEEERNEFRLATVQVSMSLTFMSGLGAEQLQTPDGIAKLLQVMAMDDHPELKASALRTMMFHPENVNRCWEKFHELNIKGGAPKTQRKKQVKKKAKKKPTRRNAKKK